MGDPEQATGNLGQEDPEQATGKKEKQAIMYVYLVLYLVLECIIRMQAVHVETKVLCSMKQSMCLMEVLCKELHEYI